MDPRRRTGSRLGQPSPGSSRSRPRLVRPTCASKPWRRSKPNMAGTRNPTGRRAHPGSRIHLTGRKPNHQKTAVEEILAKRSGELRSWRMKTVVKSPNLARFWRSTEHSSFQRFSFQHFSFTQIPLFPRNPHFPALRSDPMALSKASRRKQIPSSRQ